MFESTVDPKPVIERRQKSQHGISGCRDLHCSGPDVLESSTNVLKIPFTISYDRARGFPRCLKCATLLLMFELAREPEYSPGENEFPSTAQSAATPGRFGCFVNTDSVFTPGNAKQSAIVKMVQRCVVAFE